MTTIIKHRRGTTTQWAASTYVLKVAELGFDTTLKKFKVGDGVTLWTSLPFMEAGLDVEGVQDVIGAMVSDNTETNIVVEYNDTTGKLNFSTGADVITTTSLSNTLTDATTGYVPIGDVGQPDGVASLDSNGKIPLTELGNLIDSAPGALDTLNELAAAINDDASYAATITTALGLKAPLASPTFTGTVAGVTSTHVGLGNVDNTSDANKPVSTATQTSLDLKLNLSEPSVDYYITNSGSGTYIVNGVSNGNITFEKGKKYRIHIVATGHPFWIQTVSGAYSSGNVYSTGVTGNGTQSGYILVELPQSAPNNLYYACEFHSSMQGSINAPFSDSVIIEEKTNPYTLLPKDGGKMIEISAGGTLTVTDSSSFPVGFYVDILQTTTSQVTISGGGTTVVNGTPGTKLRTRWSSATLIKRATDLWVILGDLSV
jgi:hypothetical protein